jgi:hypothetical protein
VALPHQERGRQFPGSAEGHGPDCRFVEEEMKYFLLAVITIGVLMATFSMFGSNTRITIAGDEQGCRAYLGEANRMLYQLRMVKQPALPQRKFSDGTVMDAWTCGGFDYVNIFKPLVTGKARIIEQVKWHVCFAGYNQITSGYAWKVNKTDNKGETTWEELVSATGSYFSAYKIAGDEKANVYTVGKRFKYSSDLGYYDQYDWVVEKRDKDGEQIWIIENNEGGAIDVTADKTGVYITGRGYGEIYNGSFVRVEKRDKDDGSLVCGQNYTKLGDYDRGVACAVAKDFLYVSAYALWDDGSQHEQGRVLSVNKDTGLVESTFNGTLYTAPFARDSMQEIALAVRDVEGIGTGNVVMMTDRWVKTLDQDLSKPGNFSIDVEYGAVSVDYNTIDKGITADKDGIYTLGQVPRTGSFDYHGYEVCKFDKNGVQQWATIYAEGAGSLVGPFLADVAIDDKYVYVSGYKKEASATKSIRQAFDKKTGEIVWTKLDTPTTYNYLWGVGSTAVKTTTELEE